MLVKKPMLAALLVACASTGLLGQNAGTVVAAASKAMGVDTLTSITYSGTARNGAFGQSKAIGEPMGPVNVTQITPYTRTITFGRRPTRPPSSRARPDRRSRRHPRRPAPAGRRLQPEHHRRAGGRRTGRRRSTSGRRRGAS